MDAIKIALDAMGGDHGPKVVIPAALEVLDETPEVSFILVGDREIIENYLKKHNKNIEHPRLEIVHASQTVAMDELPSQALRNKKDSSMRVAINCVKEGKAHACVSAGNTGALMATARFVLKMLPGVDRPAILGRVPTRHAYARMLDMGANVDSSTEHLYHFAVMGSVVAEAVDGINNPKVALLNIGEEEIKGNAQVKKAAQLLSESDSINYVGYIEGSALFTGTVDVIVCDGFVGNVAVKTAEGIAKLMGYFLRRAYHHNFISKLLGLLSKGVLKRLRVDMDPSNYNGASLIGLRGTVVKSHGGANKKGFKSALYEAISEVKNEVPKKINTRIAALLETSEVV